MYLKSCEEPDSNRLPDFRILSIQYDQYRIRLEMLSLTTLETRRFRDQIEVFNISNYSKGYDGVFIVIQIPVRFKRSFTITKDSKNRR